MRNLLSVILLCFLSTAIAGTYKWVDKDGNTHYSDKPVEGAEQVKLPEPTTYNAPKAQPRAAQPEDSGGSKAEQESPGYTAFEFVAPKQDQVFWATGGEVAVQLAVKPDLRKGHEIHLYFNGNLTENSPLAGLGTMLTEAHRGAHTVRAVIVDQAGKSVATAGPITFHVKQRSVAKPPNPVKR